MKMTTLNNLYAKEFRRRYFNFKGIITRHHAYKGPDVVQVDLTNKCNSHCNVCWLYSPFVSDTGQREYELDCKVLKSFMDEIRQSGTQEIILSGGGEPFLYPNIWEVIEHAQKIGLNFRITTSLTLLDKPDIHRLASFSRLLSLTVSIWAAEAGLYSILHNRGQDSFDKAKDGLVLFNSLKGPGVRSKLFSAVSNMNYKSLKSLVDLAVSSSCDSVEFNVIDTVPGETDRFLLSQDNIAYLKNDFLMITKEKRKVDVADKRLFLRRISNPGATLGEYDSVVEEIPCYAGWFFLRLRANGDFNSCLKSHRFPLGNIYKDSFGSVWNCAQQQRFREEGLRIPRNWEYFKSMSNSPDRKGCRRMCDNIVVNEHVYNFMKYIFWIK